MTQIKFTQDETDRLVEKVKAYFSEELDQEIGSFEAQFLIDFFGNEIGAFYYNRGLADAHTLITEKSQEIAYLIEELEKATS